MMQNLSIESQSKMQIQVVGHHSGSRVWSEKVIHYSAENPIRKDEFRDLMVLVKMTKFKDMKQKHKKFTFIVDYIDKDDFVLRCSYIRNYFRAYWYLIDDSNIPYRITRIYQYKIKYKIIKGLMVPNAQREPYYRQLCGYISIPSEGEGYTSEIEDCPDGGYIY